MKLAKGFWAHASIVAIPGGILAVVLALTGWSKASVAMGAATTAALAFLAFFFRDPDRPLLSDPAVVVAGADGWVRSVESLEEPNYLKAYSIRISTFLSPFDVHVNRAPIAGTVAALDYTPGAHLFTISNKASERNEHSSILIEGRRTRCLVKQIVGPFVRRVVYWLTIGQRVEAGERIGMMKFGSRLDIYLPADDVEVLVRAGDRVRAGMTAVARIKKGSVL